MEPHTQTNHPLDKPVAPFNGRGILNGIHHLLGLTRGIPRGYTFERPQITFNDVAGEDEAKAGLREIVDFLQSVGKYQQAGAPAPLATLLVGQPGTGKTLLARAAAGEASVGFFSIDALDLVENFAGIGARQLRGLFRQAKASAPSIVFIHHLEALADQNDGRAGSARGKRAQAIQQLFIEMSTVGERQGVVILAATSRPEVLDPALLPGRFNRQVSVGLPDRKTRESILAIHTRCLRLATSTNLGIIARTTTGLTGADLARLCSEASLIAARKGSEQVSMADFEEALDRILLFAPRKLLLSENHRRVAAYHEAGHLLAAWLSPAVSPVHKVSIFPRRRAPAAPQQQDSDAPGYSKSYLLACLTVMLGGRASEELAIGDVTTRAEKDLIEATRLARCMVTRWGMGGLGPIAFEQHEEPRMPALETNQHHERNSSYNAAYNGAFHEVYSEATAARIDQEVHDLLKDRYTAATHLLSNARASLDRLVEALLENETIDLGEMTALLGPRPYDPEVDASLPVQAPQLNQT